MGFRHGIGRISDRRIGRVIRTERMLNAAIRFFGARTWMAPSSVRRQLHFGGISREQLGLVLADVASLRDFSQAWAREGAKRAERGQLLAAAVSYSIAHRVENDDLSLKQRFYEHSHASYWSASHDTPLEMIEFNWAGGLAQAALQVPSNHHHQSPTLVMMPGIGTTKEELHHLALPYLARGLAVCRLDMPGCGATEGRLDERTSEVVGQLLDRLAQDPRLDPDRLWLFGPSMGGFWALHSLSEGVRAAGVVGLSAPIRPHRTLRLVPRAHVRALERGTRLQGSALRSLCERLDLGPRAASITRPALLFTGSRDPYIPVSHTVNLANRMPTASLHVLRGERHLCLEKYDFVIARTFSRMA